MNYLRDGTTNIETVEDPIEYKIPGISQIQVNEATQLTFASALRSILRQDPDIILVGEIRDAETAQIALQAADTGHLVLSTLHTNTAASAISRLLSLGITPHSIATGVSAILAQRLVRRLCSHCKSRASGTLSAETAELLAKYQVELVDLRVAEGCESCRYTGYSGRQGIYSYLRVTSAIRKLICSGATLEEITEQACREGFIPLENSAANLLREGVSSLEELRPYLVRQTPSFSESSEEQSKYGHQRGVAAKKNAHGRILVVEDDEDTRVSLIALLRSSGHEVLGAENGLDGIRKIDGFAPTLIVSGLGMPYMDGRQLFSAVRSLKNFGRVPFIIYTGSDSEGNELELLGLGVSDFISKTRGVRVVVERIEHELRKGTE